MQQRRQGEIVKLRGPTSLIRNVKSTVIKAQVLPGKNSEVENCRKSFTQKEANYKAYSPKQYTQYLGELYLDLRKLDVK